MCCHWEGLPEEGKVFNKKNLPRVMLLQSYQIQPSNMPEPFHTGHDSQSVFY